MYDHSRKAGNRADVWKHFWLCELVSRLRPDRSGRVSMLDTHCGAGLFHRADAEEWDRGISSFDQNELASLGTYGQIVAPHLANNEYPGSWLLAATILAERQLDFTILGCDISRAVEDAFQTNVARFGFAPRCRFVRGDGYTVASDCRPYSLVFLDPPYWPDPDADWQTLCRLIPALQSSTDLVAVWYPIGDGSESDRLIATYGLVAYEIVWGGPGIAGCGFTVLPRDDIDLTEPERVASSLATILGGAYSKAST